MTFRTPRTCRTALAAGLLVLLAGCADDPAPVAEDPAERPSATKSPRGDRGGTASETPEAEASRTAAVYYVADAGDDGRAGPRLFREFRRGPADPLVAAVQLLGEAPVDPDYRTLWEPGQLVSATASDEVLTVQVDTSVRTRPDGMSAAEAEAAVQQVVYTAQAAVQARTPVKFVTEEGPTDRVLGVPTARPVRNGSMLQVLSHVNLTSPEQGAAVTGDELVVSGVGNSFEASVGWELRQGDRVVDRGFATMAGWMEDKLFPFEVTVDVSDLAPGDYTLWVTTDDPSGGTEGFGAMTDDKDFTVG